MDRIPLSEEKMLNVSLFFRLPTLCPLCTWTAECLSRMIPSVISPFHRQRRTHFSTMTMPLLRLTINQKRWVDYRSYDLSLFCTNLNCNFIFILFCRQHLTLSIPLVPLVLHLVVPVLSPALSQPPHPLKMIPLMRLELVLEVNS